MTRLMIALMLCASPLAAQDIATRPYIFTQGHNNWSQSVDFSRGMEVQLPSNLGSGGEYVVWTFDEAASRSVILTEVLRVDFPGRIAGYDMVTVFGFEAVPGGAVEIVIRANVPNPFSTDGVYRVTLTP